MNTYDHYFLNTIEGLYLNTTTQSCDCYHCVVSCVYAILRQYTLRRCIDGRGGGGLDGDPRHIANRDLRFNVEYDGVF